MNVRDIAVKYAHLLSAPDYSRLLKDADYIDWLRFEWQKHVAEIERLTRLHDTGKDIIAERDREIERLFASEQWLLGENAKLQAVVDAAKEFKEWWHEDMRGSVSYDKLCAAIAALKEADDD